MSSILIVEDDVLTNQYLEFILEQAGYEVVSATSADEAAALLEDRDDIQLIVTDINLPGTMNGLRLAAAVKARRPEINIIIVTGLRCASGRRDPARQLIRSKAIRCPKNDRGSTAFPVATPPAQHPAHGVLSWHRIGSRGSGGTSLGFATGDANRLAQSSPFWARSIPNAMV